MFTALVSAILAAVVVGCGKTPTTVAGASPSASPPEASASSAPSAAAVASAPLAPSASAKRPPGCWSNTPWTEPKQRLEALGVRCAKGFRPLLPSTFVKAGTALDFTLPPNTCARVVFVGDKPVARLERPDGSVFARGAGDADVVLPETGPFCTAKGETVKLHVSAEGQAAVFASP